MSTVPIRLFRLSDLFRPAAPDLPEPLCQSSRAVRYYGYARTALRDALTVAGLRGGDEVLLPDLICMSVMAPLHDLGLTPRFYGLGAALHPDLESARQLVSPRTKAFIGINYFGFPFPIQPVRSFCGEYGLWLIEDNAHGFLGRENDVALGQRGDLGVFSFRKTIPLVNGAALIVTHPTLLDRLAGLPRRVKREPGLGRWVSSNFLKRFALKFWPRIGPKIDALVGGLWPEVSESDDEHSVPDFAFDHTSHWLLRRWPLVVEAQERRRRYAEIGQAIAGRDDIAPVCHSLATGVVPQAFPALVTDPARWFSWAARAKVRAYAWPIPPQSLRERTANGWGRKLILLPVTTDIAEQMAIASV
jgi:hypothetical protein